MTEPVVLGVYYCRATVCMLFEVEGRQAVPSSFSTVTISNPVISEIGNFKELPFKHD